MSDCIKKISKCSLLCINLIIELLTVTRLLAKIINRTTDIKKHADYIRNFNSIYLALTIIFVSILIFEKSIPFYFVGFKNLIYILMFYYCFSRVNEVFLSFLNDAFDKLEKKENDCDDTLKYHERIKLALKSYIELVLDYGIIFFVLTKDCFNQLLSCERAFNENVDNIFEAIYFSGVTMTTLGYGDLSPESVITKFFSLYAVANGMLLIIVCFTVYVSLSFYSSCTDYKIDKKKSVKREIIFLIINFTVFIFLCVIHF